MTGRSTDFKIGPPESAWPQGRIDRPWLDKAGAFVVLELKVSRGYDRVVGELLRYMNWVRKELVESGQRA